MNVKVPERDAAVRDDRARLMSCQCPAVQLGGQSRAEAGAPDVAARER